MKLGKGGKIVIVVVVAAMTIVGLSDLIFLVPDQSSQSDIQSDNTNIPTSTSMQTVTLTTDDNVTIAGDYYPSSHKGGIVYLHMMPDVKSSYKQLAERMARVGYDGIAIDLRGHGDSQGGPDGYKQFTDDQHQASSKDIAAAIAFLKKQGIAEQNIELVGASIGANLAIQYASVHHSVPAVVAISPGLNYHGLMASKAAALLSAPQRVFLASSPLDPNVSGDVEQTATIKSSIPQGVVVQSKIYNIAAHGTDIMTSPSELEDDIAAFITGGL